MFGDPKVLQSYYYAITHFIVGGRCKCNGHSNVCIPRYYKYIFFYKLTNIFHLIYPQ